MSFLGSRGMGGGGGGMSGGGMFRAATRVSRAGVNGLQIDDDRATSNSSDTDRPPPSPTSPTNNRGISASPTSSASTPSSSSLFRSKGMPFFPASGGWPLLNPSFTDEFEWEYMDEAAAADGEKAKAAETGFSDELLFGSPPSVHEVEDALLSLQQVIRSAATFDAEKDGPDQIWSAASSMKSASSTHSDLDWMEPPFQCRVVQPCGLNRVYDAFNLLETEPSIQKMVVSLSSDRAVWDAVLNNEAVRELRESFDQGEEKARRNSSENNNQSPASAAAGALSWIFENMKAKFMDVIANLTKLVHGLLRHLDNEKKDDGGDALMEKMRASFMLTVIVLFVVVVGRTNPA